MKKFTFVLIMMLGFWGFTMAQTIIENFEPSIQMNLMAAGANGSLTVVPNPDTVGNHSLYVVKFVRGKGDPWGGFWGMVTNKIDLTTNKYVHVKVWKPRKSPVKVKIEKGSGADLEIASINLQTKTNAWEELVFNFSTISGTYDGFNLMPDFEDPLTLATDQIIYFDDLTINNNPAVGSPALQVVDDFESIPLTPMNNQGTFTLIPNGHKTGINLSAYVTDFLRLKDGVAWSGFYSNLPKVVDVTTNKYVHVKLWKPRKSVVKFKLEGGAAGTLEIASMNAQTKTNEWEDFVFDFTGKTGTYPIIALLPDISDSALTADNHIYIDDIIVNNNPAPIEVTHRFVNVNMKGSGLTAGQKVFISGNFGGAYGDWAAPGDKPGNEMLDPNNDSIYSIEMIVPDGKFEFKFFRGTGWGNGDDKGGNRKLDFIGNLNITYKWGIKAANLTLNVNIKGKKIASGTPIYVSGDFKGDYGDWDLPGTNMMCKLTDADGDSVYTILLHLAEVKTYYFKFYAGSGWTGKEGPDDRVLVVPGDMVANCIWGVIGYVAVREKPLAGIIQMYPNPVLNELNIRSTADLSRILITNTLGKTVGNITYTGEQSINTSNLSRGVYFVTFVGRDGNKVTQKLIKN